MEIFNIPMKNCIDEFGVFNYVIDIDLLTLKILTIFVLHFKYRVLVTISCEISMHNPSFT